MEALSHSIIQGQENCADHIHRKVCVCTYMVFGLKFVLFLCLISSKYVHKLLLANDAVSPARHPPTPSHTPHTHTHTHTPSHTHTHTAAVPLELGSFILTVH